GIRATVCPQLRLISRQPETVSAGDWLRGYLHNSSGLGKHAFDERAGTHPRSRHSEDAWVYARGHSRNASRRSGDLGADRRRARNSSGVGTVRFDQQSPHAGAAIEGVERDAAHCSSKSAHSFDDRTCKCADSVPRRITQSNPRFAQTHWMRLWLSQLLTICATWLCERLRP